MSRTYPIRFGEHDAYELSEEALKHILRGEFAVRLVTKSGVRTTEPYSHWHSINFNIAESTVLHERYARVCGAVFPQGQFRMQELLKLTPEFVLRRPRRDPATGIDSWRDTREKELMAAAPLMTPGELAKIKAYLNDYVCSKDPYGVQANLYLHYADDISRLDPVFNAAQVTENVAECIQVLTHSDLKHGTRHAMDAMLRFLKMAIVHAGGLSTLMFKRVLGEFAEAAAGHHDENSLREFFAALAASPCRATLYTEFDLSPFVKKNDELGWAVIGNPTVEMDLEPEHLYEFIALNLGRTTFSSLRTSAWPLHADCSLNRGGS